VHSHREGLFLFENHPDFSPSWDQLCFALEGITDEDLAEAFNVAAARRENCKSLSDAINRLIDERLPSEDWQRESPIFNDEEYLSRRETRWRLDFANDLIAVEVAFNHGEAIAWNLLKPVLAAELNHVDKAVQSRAGVVITVTEQMKRAGNFDAAVGTYEKFLRYLPPLMDHLTVPMVIIGLEPPRGFSIPRVGDHARTVRWFDKYPEVQESLY
jgi:hypothetical protein